MRLPGSAGRSARAPALRETRLPSRHADPELGSQNLIEDRARTDDRPVNLAPVEQGRTGAPCLTRSAQDGLRSEAAFGLRLDGDLVASGLGLPRRVSRSASTARLRVAEQALPIALLGATRRAHVDDTQESRFQHVVSALKEARPLACRATAIS